MVKLESFGMMEMSTVSSVGVEGVEVGLVGG